MEYKPPKKGRLLTPEQKAALAERLAQHRAQKTVKVLETA